MMGFRKQRNLFLVAALAISAALLLLLLPVAHSGHAPAWFVFLPVFFIGVISPLGALASLVWVCARRVPESPFRPSSFERPPPVQLG